MSLVPRFIIPEEHASGTGSDREVVSEVPSETRAPYRRESEGVDYKWGLPMPPGTILRASASGLVTAQAPVDAVAHGNEAAAKKKIS